MAITSSQLAGQRLMLGVPGTQGLQETIQLFKDTQAAGLIVFRRNFKSAAAFKEWLAALENGLGRRLIVAVDHEGGRVIHLWEGVTYFPDNLVLGWTGSEEYARQQGAMEAGELRQLGIDLNLAPTIDVLTASYSPNIGIRSYGKDAELVSRLGTARIQGMQMRGLSACAKHFPGQGQSPLDAHLDLPVLPTTQQEYDALHSLPFKAAILAGVDTVMTSHPVYPELDSNKVPATFSHRIVTGLLRDALGFKGVILSDDLEMGALKNYGSIGECAVRAITAGHDMVLICSDPRAAREAALKLTRAIEDKVISPEFLDASGERLNTLSAKRQKRFSEMDGSLSAEGHALALKIAREGLGKSKVFRGTTATLKVCQGDERLVLYPRLSVLGERIAMEPEMENDRGFIQGILKSSGLAASVVTVALEPDEKEQLSVLQAARNAEETVYFCFDPHLHQGSKKLLNLLEAEAKNLKVIFLRDPFGADLLVRKTPYLNAFGFRSVQIQTALELLCGFEFETISPLPPPCSSGEVGRGQEKVL